MSCGMSLPPFAHPRDGMIVLVPPQPGSGGEGRSRGQNNGSLTVFSVSHNDGQQLFCKESEGVSRLCLRRDRSAQRRGPGKAGSHRPLRPALGRVLGVTATRLGTGTLEPRPQHAPHSLSASLPGRVGTAGTHCWMHTCICRFIPVSGKIIRTISSTPNQGDTAPSELFRRWGLGTGTVGRGGRRGLPTDPGSASRAGSKRAGPDRPLREHCPLPADRRSAVSELLPQRPSK